MTRARHERIVAEERQRAYEEGVTAGAESMAKTMERRERGESAAHREYAAIREREIREAREEVRRLTDIIVELKKEGREVPHPKDEDWRSSSTAEGDRQYMESHDQEATTDGAHPAYPDMVELERAAEQALNADFLAGQN